MLVEPFPFDWSRLWNSLNHVTWIFVYALGLVSLYAVYFATFVSIRLRSFRTVQNDEFVRESLAQLDYQSANLRQLILAMFYFFGFTFFFQLRFAYYTPENNRPVGPMVLENFKSDFNFAGFIFLVFLALHSVQWFVSGRIRRAVFRLSANVTR